jgi:rod shape-determining protein MreC
MSIYSPGRRRAIVLLLLTSVLLLTLDLRGNAVFDAARSGFNVFMHPLESAADVATKPIINAWRGITQWEQVREENDRLREQIAAQRADQIAAQAAIQDTQELMAERDLPSLGTYPRVTARVIGPRPSNLDQIVQIDKGRNHGIRVGMAVVGPGGLVGKITTPLLADTAYVMLITDTRYATAAKVIAGTPPTTTTTAPPSTTAPDGSLPPDSVPEDSVPGDSVPTSEPGETPTQTTTPGSVPTSEPPASVPPTSEPTPTTTLPTTTTIDMTLVRDTGMLVGRGPSSLPQVDLLGDTPVIGQITENDLVFTAGGDDNLAPPGIPIGIVRNVIRRSSAEGPLLEVEPSADLDRLNFVDIILYRSPSEAGGTIGSQAGG